MVTSASAYQKFNVANTNELLEFELVKVSQKVFDSNYSKVQLIWATIVYKCLKCIRLT